MLTLALAAVLSQSMNPYAGVTWKNPLPGYLDGPVYARIWTRVTDKADAPAPVAPIQVTDFKPAQPRSVAKAIVGGSTVNKAAASALIDGLNAGLDAFEKEARKNNVAHALAFLIGVSQQTLSGKEFTDEENARYAQAINDELAAAPQFKKLGAKQKQLIYENAIVAGALIGGIAALAAEENDAEARQQAKGLAAQALVTFQRAARSP